MEGGVHMRSTGMSSIPPLVEREVLPGFLVRMLLLQSGDVETNPGPVERASTMVLMPMSTSTPTSEPLDSTIYAAIIVPVITVLCVCLLSTLCCCVCSWRIKRRARYCDRHSRIDASEAQDQEGYGSPAPVLFKWTPMQTPPDSPLAPGMDFAYGSSTSYAYLQPFGTHYRNPVPWTLSPPMRHSRGAEFDLERLCYIRSGIAQLSIDQDGGRFKLGSGDAELIADMGAVAVRTDVRYAIILHGPFVYSACYKPASVVVYLNLEGATILKPIKLILRHWGKTTDVDAALRCQLLRAPHTLDKSLGYYNFEEVEGTASSDHVVFSISEPQCLYCVQIEKETKARYNAAAFQMNLVDSVMFRIQLMCDSLDWSTTLRRLLQEKGWENSSKVPVFAPFSFVSHEIKATPDKASGPGWNAAITGCHEVTEVDFLRILGKTKDVCVSEIQSDRYPPYISYQVTYSCEAEQRKVRTLLSTALIGADKTLSFSCTVMQMEESFGECSTRSSGQGVTTIATMGSQCDVSQKLQLNSLTKWVVPRVVSNWYMVGLQLSMEQYFLDGVKADGGDHETRCLDMFRKWLDGKTGSGILPRTWDSVLNAVEAAVGSEVRKTIEQNISHEGTDGSSSSAPPAKKAKQ